MSAAPIPKTAPFADDEIDVLNRVVGPATAVQRAWLAGFLAGLDVVHQLTDFVLNVGDILGNGVTVAIGGTGTILTSHDVPLLPAALSSREFSGPTLERWNRFPAARHRGFRGLM